MHIDLKEEIEIPEKVEIKVEGLLLTVKGSKGELKRKFPLKINHDGKKLIIEIKNATKRDKNLLKTGVAHIKNMIKGVIEGYKYSLQICSVHFPMNVSATKDQIIIKNFLGEAKERKAVILPTVKVEIKGDIINLESPDKEAAGQTAANIETSTHVKARDRRIFQDGIWIIEKAGQKIE
jgi:large subunit ribosomal protein L6